MVVIPLLRFALSPGSVNVCPCSELRDEYKTLPSGLSTHIARMLVLRSI